MDPKPLIRNPIVLHRRTFFLEALTSPFSRKELRAVASGNPDIKAPYYLLYIGNTTILHANSRPDNTTDSNVQARLITIFAMWTSYGTSNHSYCPTAYNGGTRLTQTLPKVTVVIMAGLAPLFGYHFLMRKYVISMHVYVPPQARTSLRDFTKYVNAFDDGTIIRFRTFRLLLGTKSHIIPIEELKFILAPGEIQTFEKNVEWISKSRRSRTWLGEAKAWYLQPGLGGQEMDAFWRRIGMDSVAVKEARTKAAAEIKGMALRKKEDMKRVMKIYRSSDKKKSEKEVEAKKEPKPITLD